MSRVCPDSKCLKTQYNYSTVEEDRSTKLYLNILPKLYQQVLPLIMKKKLFFISNFSALEIDLRKDFFPNFGSKKVLFRLIGEKKCHF